mmetsp:Transcript_2240/g.5520  ORF Transcript_2240/g.5520 Transcript_2240/m.5520 type:complete len:442 (+) Transcript_2240:2710-4035(+)
MLLLLLHCYLLLWKALMARCRCWSGHLLGLNILLSLKLLKLHGVPSFLLLQCLHLLRLMQLLLLHHLVLGMMLLWLLHHLILRLLLLLLLLPAVAGAPVGGGLGYGLIGMGPRLEPEHAGFGGRGLALVLSISLVRSGSGCGRGRRGRRQRRLLGPFVRSGGRAIEHRRGRPEDDGRLRRLRLLAGGGRALAPVVQRAVARRDGIGGRRRLLRPPGALVVPQRGRHAVREVAPLVAVAATVDALVSGQGMHQVRLLLLLLLLLLGCRHRRQSRLLLYRKHGILNLVQQRGRVGGRDGAARHAQLGTAAVPIRLVVVAVRQIVEDGVGRRHRRRGQEETGRLRCGLAAAAAAGIAAYHHRRHGRLAVWHVLSQLYYLLCPSCNNLSKCSVIILCQRSRGFHFLGSRSTTLSPCDELGSFGSTMTPASSSHQLSPVLWLAPVL